MSNLESLLEQQNALLSRIAVALEGGQKKQALGLTNNTGSVRIYCQRQENSNAAWYRWVNDAPVTVEESALIGYLKSIEFKEKVFKGKTSYKLIATLDCGDTGSYQLEAGADSQFSKGLLSAVASLTPNDLRQPLTIQPQPSDQEEKILFCRVYCNGNLVKAPYDQDTNWREVTLRARAALEVALNGELIEGEF